MRDKRATYVQPNQLDPVQPKPLKTVQPNQEKIAQLRTFLKNYRTKSPRGYDPVYPIEESELDADGHPIPGY